MQENFHPHTCFTSANADIDNVTPVNEADIKCFYWLWSFGVDSDTL